MAPRLKRHKRALAHLALAYPEKTGCGARPDRSRDVGTSRPHLCRVLPHGGDRSRRTASLVEAPEAHRADAAEGALCRLRAASGQLGDHGARVRADRPTVGRRLPAADQSAGRSRRCYASCARRCIRWVCSRAPPRKPAQARSRSPRRADRWGFSPILREGKGESPAPFFGRPAFSNPTPAQIARALRPAGLRGARDSQARGAIRVAGSNRWKSP